MLIRTQNLQRVLLVVAGCCSLLLASCSNKAELRRLREENDRLRKQLDELSKQMAQSRDVKLATIREFTVGLAAAEKSFDEGAFLNLLKGSLEGASADGSAFAVEVETKEHQIAKARGMLVQQYLSEQKVPIRISNISYKLKSPEDVFKVGGATIPPDSVQVQKTADGLTRVSYQGPLLGHMSRSSQGEYSISYEDSGGGRGEIPISIDDVEVFDPSQPPKAARQGDIALNWELSLEKVQVYRVVNFTGDIGKFMLWMRYPESESGMNQYQTIRDSVYLFGYGPYVTSLYNTITTPAHIDKVEIMAVDDVTFEKLASGLSEDQVATLLTGSWVGCKFVEFSGNQKTWERPPSVGFPFVSRQTSTEESRIFYIKYRPEGSRLVDEYAIGGK